MIISCWCDTCVKQIGCGIFFTFSLNPTSVVFRRWTYLHILKCCVYCLCILSYIHMIIFKNKHSLRKCMHIYTCRHMQMHQRWVGKMINYIFNIDFVLLNLIQYFKRQKNECHKYAFTHSCSLFLTTREFVYLYYAVLSWSFKRVEVKTPLLSISLSHCSKMNTFANNVFKIEST